jgi:hypothetical protein
MRRNELAFGIACSLREAVVGDGETRTSTAKAVCSLQKSGCADGKTHLGTA